jgi:hypothetical protein
MINREKDARVELMVYGKVPCYGWKDFNWGSAGGPALMKECDHPNDACYPAPDLQAKFSSLGGPGRFTASMDLTMEMLLHFQKRWPDKVAELTNALDTELHLQASSLFDGDLPEKIVDVVLSCAEQLKGMLENDTRPS